MTAVAERLNKSTAATYLGVSERTLDLWRAQDRGPRSHKIGGRLYWLTADCDEVAQRPAHRNSTRRRAVTRHLRNPIKWHGDSPRDHFTMIPNELARDTELTLYAYRIAIVIRTHAEGYEVSAASLAKMQGWHRDTVGKALRELAQAGWLVVRTHKTAEGKRVFDEYHVHASRKFTEAEAATLSQPVILPTAAHDGGTPLPTEQATSCLPERHPPAYGVGTKENQSRTPTRRKTRTPSVRKQVRLLGLPRAWARMHHPRPQARAGERRDQRTRLARLADYR
ncbi:hypothetical protein [Mycobacterium sp.]|uniref:hypothetical protein n=1 Tax=Mycobacterium sp. TaxID=1785 RepID=UPI003F9D9644